MYFLSKLFLISDCKSSSAHIKPGLPQWLRLYCYLCSALNLTPMCLNLLSLVRATIKRVNSHSHTNHWRSGQDPQYPTISHSPGISVNTQRGQFIGEWNSYEDLAKREAGCSAKLLLTHLWVDGGKYKVLKSVLLIRPVRGAACVNVKCKILLPALIKWLLCAAF